MKLKLLNGIRGLFRNRFLESILVRFTVGKTFGTWVTKLPPNHYQYPKGSTRRSVRDGISYVLDISDMVDWYIYFGFNEPSRQTLLGLITKDAYVLDVGANIGQVTMNASKLVGPAGKVIAFEPDPLNFDRLLTNLQLNYVPNVTVEQLGLGDKAGSFLISNVDVGNQGMNRIVKLGSDQGRTSTIEVTTIDTYVREHNFERVDVIKIDVEGFEFNVLNGAKATMEKWHPVLFIELDDENLMQQGSSARELVGLLDGLSYKVTHAETRHPITIATDFNRCHFDVVARLA